MKPEFFKPQNNLDMRFVQGRKPKEMGKLLADATVRSLIALSNLEAMLSKDIQEKFQGTIDSVTVERPKLTTADEGGATFVVRLKVDGDIEMDMGKRHLAWPLRAAV